MPATILLVADNLGASLVQEALVAGTPDTKVVVVGTITDAVAELSGKTFDCVLLDLAVPGAEGPDAIGTLLACGAPPIVVITDDEGDGDALGLAALGRGAEDYLAKSSLSANLLARSLRYALSRGKAADQLEEQTARYRWALESLDEGLVVYGPDGEVKYHNSAAGRILGGADHLPVLAGSDDQIALLLADGALLSPRDAPVPFTLRTGDTVAEMTMGIRRPSGEVRWLSVNAGPIAAIDGALEMGVVVSFRDTTTTRDALRRVQLSFDQSAIGLALADHAGRFTEVNPSLCSVLGRTKDALLGTSLADYASPESTARYYASQLTSSNHDQHSAELPFFRPDGDQLWLSVVTNLVREVTGDDYWLVQLRDVSARRHAELALETLAIYDPLTGLPNQSLLKDRVDQALNRAQQDGTRVAVLLLGLDRFRVVTDSLGHAVGEALLAQFGASLQAAFTDRTVARHGGDVFAVVIEAAGAVGDIVEWAQRQLSAANHHRFEVEGSELYVAFSTGIAVSGPDVTAEDLLRNADVAMSRAKQAGGAKVIAFEDRDLEAVRQRLSLETDLRHALAEGQISVAYQPVVRTDDHSIVGAEALARWHHPRRGNLEPDVFIPLLVGMGLAGELTSHMLRMACAQVVQWKAEHKVADDFRVSVNLSADDLANPELAEEVRQVLETSGLEPGHLALEVTETGLVRDTEAALVCLRAIRRLGVHLAVDDFGTGYSSLSYLNMFPVDVVKIDKSFVLGLGRDADATALVRGVLSLTRALGLTAVAEGIENEIQLEALRQLGCGLAQGYYWSRPVPPEQFPSAFNMPPAPDNNALLALARPDPQVTDQDQHLGWAVLDALPTAVAVIGTNGTILATNLSWKSLGVERRQTAAQYGVGSDYVAFLEGMRGQRGADTAMAARGLRAVLADDRDAFTLEYEVTNDDGARWFLMLVSPVASRGGGAVVAHLDITPRHIAEQALAESEERFHSIFDQAPLGIFRLGRNGRVVDANPALCKLLGRSADNIQGSLRADLFDDQPEEPAGGNHGVDGRADHPDGHRSSRRQVRRPDGTLRTVQVNDVGVEDKDGGAHALVATVEDITDGLRLAEQLRRAQEIEALGRVAAGIAHEINTPTQFISDNLTFLSNIWRPVAAALEALRDAAARLHAGADPAEIAALLQRVCQDADLDFLGVEVPAALSQSQEGVERVATIVRAMKAFGHPDNDDPEPTDINRLVKNTVTVARNELKYVADVETDYSTLPSVVCYQGAIGQVILNLLVNAAYAVGKSRDVTGERGRISVSTWEEAAEVCIGVSDTGPGIPQEVLPHIFEPFFTTKPPGHGTGQGLAMAWVTIVERHKGHIEVTTSKAGTTFVVRLPLVARRSEPKLLAVSGV